jgi:uncharacterized membrane protein
MLKLFLPYNFMQMKRKSKKNKFPLVKTSQEAFIVVVAFIFISSAFFSGKVLYDTKSQGLAPGGPFLFNFLIITLLIPVSIFVYFYQFLHKKKLNHNGVSAVFWSLVYTVVVYVAAGVLNYYLLIETSNAGYAMTDWQFFSMELLCILAGVLIVSALPLLLKQLPVRKS